MVSEIIPVVILFNNFEYTIHYINKDDNGNWLQMIITVSDIKINLITIYAPNQDNPAFFGTIRALAEQINTNYVLICGDLNLELDPFKDCYNYANINNPRSRQKVADLTSELDLVDVIRYLYPNQKRYTWRKKNPIKEARLDYFLATASMTDIIDKCNIIRAIGLITLYFSYK